MPRRTWTWRMPSKSTPLPARQIIRDKGQNKSWTFKFREWFQIKNNSMGRHMWRAPSKASSTSSSPIHLKTQTLFSFSRVDTLRFNIVFATRIRKHGLRNRLQKSMRTPWLAAKKREHFSGRYLLCELAPPSTCYDKSNVLVMTSLM